MHNLLIDSRSAESIRNSFSAIANTLLKDYKLQVNDSWYRLLDIEFYYYAAGVYEDVYAHRHHAQLESGKWYFHGSGIDITCGNGNHYGGILIRAIAEMKPEAGKEKHFVFEEIHGPLNVKTKICSNLHGVFEDRPNIFRLVNIGADPMGALMKEPEFLIPTKRIGLNPDKDIDGNFYSAPLRYVIFPHLKLRDKSQIASDMQAHFPELSISDINKAMGSKFL